MGHDGRHPGGRAVCRSITRNADSLEIKMRCKVRLYIWCELYQMST